MGKKDLITSPAGLLSSYRVVDLCDERGAFAGALLAMLGAEVVMAEPPAGAAIRHRPPFVADTPGVERSLVHHAMSRGKKSVVVEERNDLAALIASADVVVECDRDPDLPGVHAGLVRATISAFGSTGPKSAWAASDLVIAASGGQLYFSGNADRPPLRCAVPQTWLHASADAVVGVLLALQQRARSGCGQDIDISAQHSWTLAGFTYPFQRLWGESDVTRNGSNCKVGDVAHRWEYAARDGHVTVLLLFGSAVGPFTTRLVNWLREEGALHPSLETTDWFEFRPDRDVDRFDQLKEDLAAFFVDRTKAEIFSIARERRLLVAPVATLREVLADAQFEDREFWRSVQVPGHPDSVLLPGPFVRMTPTGLSEVDAAPTLGEHTHSLSTHVPEVIDATAADRSVPPLEGLRVLDMTVSFAGPAIGRILADFGATVVKIESHARPDQARHVGPVLGDHGVDSAAGFAHYNAGKLSLALNLSKPMSRSVLADMVAWADVLIESNAPGALVRLGLDHATLDSLNPSLITMSSSLLGQTGPLADLAGYGNMASALCGFYTTTSWPDRDPVGPVGAYTDIISPRFATAAVLAALDHRRRTGSGSKLDFGQGEACLHLLAMGFIDTQVNGRSWERQGNDDQFDAPHGAYPTRGDDNWVAVTVHTDAQWAALAALLDHLELVDLDRTARIERRVEIDKLVSVWTSLHSSQEAALILQRSAIPAHEVQGGAACLADGQLQHRGWIVKAQHGAIGELFIGSSTIQLSHTGAHSDRAGPCLGENTFEVLTEFLGYDVDRIADLAAAEVLE
jgi:crotonobetainyl-CoA:carnitine CoA-transferase CaiB-like acyl-CoA transferase